MLGSMTQKVIEWIGSEHNVLTKFPKGSGKAKSSSCSSVGGTDLGLAFPLKNPVIGWEKESFPRASLSTWLRRETSRSRPPGYREKDMRKFPHHVYGF